MAEHDLDAGPVDIGAYVFVPLNRFLSYSANEKMILYQHKGDIIFCFDELIPPEKEIDPSEKGTWCLKQI